MRARVVVATAGVLLLAACGTEPSSPGASPAPSASQTPSATTPAGALPGLAPFLAAARAVDARLAAAARLVNGGVTATTMAFDARTVAAVRAADPAPALAAVPAGLDPPLLQGVLTVYSGLVSRHRAMATVRVGTFPRAGTDAAEILRCLRNGHAAAARFAGDVRAVEGLAAASAPVRRAAATSRAAAELALRAADIRLRNSGCGECGGYVALALAPVVWDTRHTATRYTGAITRIPFVATYDRSGWVVRMNAC
ncbi:MAG TPA: hypothetical protein VNQ77_05170 [Frankiaceae bacterium]|nr:hypothetical protein [Frankiaceae bacterium]